MMLMHCTISVSVHWKLRMWIPRRAKS